jgi:DNA-binding beta-propeller fold protein YncE
VGGGESTSVAVLSIQTGARFARLGPVPAWKDAYALSASTHRLYLTARDNSSPASLLAIDTRSLGVVVREQLSTMSARTTTLGNLALDGAYAMETSLDGTRLLMDALNGVIQGIALINVANLTPTEFLAPLYVSPGGIVRLPTQSGEDRYLVVGARTPYWSAPRADYMYVIGDRPLAVLDSFQLTPPTADGSLGLLQAVPSVDDSTVFVLTSDSVLRFEVTSNRVQASAPRPSLGGVFLSPDESRLYVTDPGVWPDSPGSGFVYVYSSSLNALTPIDLRSASNVLPVSNSAAFTRDTRYLLVSSGTASRGPLYGPQPGRVFVIDLSTNAVVRVIATGDWLAKEVFVF